MVAQQQKKNTIRNNDNLTKSTIFRVYRVCQKTGPSLKVYITPAYDDVGRRSHAQCSALHRELDCFMNVAIFKYSLHKFRETIVHQKYQLI